MSRRVRTRHVSVSDDDVDVIVDIHVIVHNNQRTRDEHAILTERVASGVMEIMPGLPYIYSPLSNVKVK